MDNRTNLKDTSEKKLDIVELENEWAFLKYQTSICRLVTTSNLDIKDLQEIYTLILEKKSKKSVS